MLYLSPDENGTGAHLLKASAKRRRTKDEMAVVREVPPGGNQREAQLQQ